MSRFVQIAVPHVGGSIFALDEDGRLWQSAGVHDGPTRMDRTPDRPAHHGRVAAQRPRRPGIRGRF